MKKPKKLKVFYNGVRMKDVYPYATKWQVFKYKLARLLRKLFMTGIGVIGTVAMFYVLQVVHGQEIAVSQNVITIEKEVPAEQDLPPVMQRIAKCESGDTHYDKHGQVVFNGNSDGTVDIGRFQINEYYWSEEAGELGLDLTKEEDNLKMAMYIYHNYGTGAWRWSKECWN